MAYIDFYRKGIKYRAILGQAQLIGNFTISSGPANNTFTFSPSNNEGEGWKVKSEGTNLAKLLNVEYLDWNNPPDTNRNVKGYKFENSDKTLSLFVVKKADVNLSADGTISKYSYRGTQYSIEFCVGGFNSNYQTRTVLAFTLPAVNISALSQNNEPPNGGTKIPRISDATPFLCGCNVVHNGVNRLGIAVTTIDVFKANRIIYGKNDALEGDYVRVYGAGCSYDLVGKALNILARPTIMVTDLEKWTYGAKPLERQLIGSGNTVNEDYRIWNANWSHFIFSTTSEPDNTDYPNYPDDGTGDNPNPDEPTGGDGDHDKESEDITDDTVNPSYQLTGLVTIYELVQSSLKELGKELWSENVFTKFLKITGNPIDSIIGLFVSYITFDAETTTSIMLGNVELDITAPNVTNTIKDIDLGTISINHFWGDFKDYNPYTKIQIYLPYIGVIDLNANEVMNSIIKLKYRFNLLSNTCVAMITVQKTIDETQLNSVLYQYDGSFIEEIPVSAASNNTRISARLAQLGAINQATRQIGNTYINQGTSGQGILNMATSAVNAGVNIMQNEIDANHLDVSRTGVLRGSAGILSIASPYIIIERCIPSYPSSYAKNLGVPLNRTLKLSSLKGFTQVQEIFISSFTGTDNEYSELISLLQQGVVF